MHHILTEEPRICERDGDEKGIRYLMSTGITPAILIEVSCDSCNWSAACTACLSTSKSDYAREHKLVSR